MYKVESYIYDDQMGVLENVNVREQNFAGATKPGVKTNVNGKFTLNVESKSSLIQVSSVGFTTVVIPAEEFGSYLQLETENNTLENVSIVGKGSSNAGLYLILAAAAALALYLLFKDNSPKPKKVIA